MYVIDNEQSLPKAEKAQKRERETKVKIRLSYFFFNLQVLFPSDTALQKKSTIFSQCCQLCVHFIIEKDIWSYVKKFKKNPTFFVQKVTLFKI